MNKQNDTIWLKQQLIELQSQLAFQEDTLQALNNVVTRQQQQIESLNELCSSNQSKIDFLATQRGTGDPQDSRPPHY